MYPSKVVNTNAKEKKTFRILGEAVFTIKTT